MTKEELETIIKEEIINVAPDVNEDEIPFRQNLQLALEIDSYDSLQVLVALAERTGVEVPESDYSKVDTLEHMIDYFFDKL